MRKAEEILDAVRSTLPGSMVPWSEAIAAIEQAQREALEAAAAEAVAWGRPDMADMIRDLLP